ncbi:MAG TPA: G1 family glutamic endopeptidase [Solirubrobacteraceae bacterium]|nr:G1 family glutamic endopeptidase [Solirubrobacteraceae bacterium]
MKKRLLVSVVPALACFAFAAPALAATQEAVSENWAGYVASSQSDSGFSAASGAWNQPKVDCSTTQESAYSAYWVGLGGGGQQSQALEQIGTQADCENGTANYYAWYELVPSAPVKLKLTINPGDHVWARTAVDGDKVAFYITDQTTHQTWTKTLTMTAAAPDTSTAEWVAEAPSECAGGATGDCSPLPLANFGTATFSDAYTTSGGHTGSISDSHWTAEAIELAPSSSSLFGGGPGGYFSGGGYGYSSYSSYSDSSAGAAPTALTTDGTKFSIKYGAALDAQSSGSGEPQTQGSSGGYGSSGGDGYSGDGYGYGGGSYGYGGGSYGGGGGGYGGWGY